MIRWFERHNKLSWVITILIAVLIFRFSTLTSGVGIGKAYTINTLPIIYHIVIFFFLSIFLFISLVKGRENWELLSFSLLILISYAIFDEIHQFFVPGRFCALPDVFFDLIGVVFAFMVYYISIMYRRKL